MSRIDFHRPARSSVPLEAAHASIRSEVPFYDADRYFAPDIRRAQQWVHAGGLAAAVAELARMLPSSAAT